METGLQRLRGIVRGSSRTQALVCLILLAFVLQIAVTRSHFHFGDALDGTGTALAASETPSAQGAGDTPGQPAHDEANCPLWHAAGVCGAVAASVASVLFIAAPVPSRIAVDERTIVPERFAAAWRSRAPPSV